MINFPDAPTLNQIVTSPNGIEWSWNGSSWLLVGVGLAVGGGSGGGCTADSIPPPLPDVGDMWYDTTTGRTYIWYDSVWSEMTGVPSSINAADLLGTTLASNVVNSSLTSVGTLGTLQINTPVAPAMEIRGAGSGIRLFDRDLTNDYSSINRQNDVFHIWESTTGQDVLQIDTAGRLALSSLGLKPFVGVVSCTSTTKPTGVNGLVVYETDTRRLKLYDGTGWIIMFEPWQQVLGWGGAGDFSAGSGSMLMYAQRSMGMVDFKCQCGLGSGFAIYANPRVGLPYTASGAHGFDNAGQHFEAGAWDTSFGIIRLHTSADATSIALQTYSDPLKGWFQPISWTNPFTWKVNDVFWVQGRYAMGSLYNGGA